MDERDLPTLTVIICCSNDTDVAHTIESIDDPDVEVVATITPNRLIEQYLDMRSIPFAVTPCGNHAVTTNAGIDLARTDAVLIVDSDTVLLPGTVRRTRRALVHHDVVNLPIGFAAADSALSRTIAALRDWDNSYDSPAYKPGIAFSLSLASKIGGHFYDERVAWPCDAELLSRLRRHRIAIHHLDRGGIVHRPIPARHLFRAYYHYGVGDAQQMFEIGHDTHWRPLRNLAFRYRHGLAEGLRLGTASFVALLAAVDSASLAGILLEGARIRRDHASRAQAEPRGA